MPIAPYPFQGALPGVGFVRLSRSARSFGWFCSSFAVSMFIVSFCCPVVVVVLVGCRRLLFRSVLSVAALSGVDGQSTAIDRR